MAGILPSGPRKRQGGNDVARNHALCPESLGGEAGGPRVQPDRCCRCNEGVGPARQERTDDAAAAARSNNRKGGRVV
ncbi:MAG: hypothetical protein NWP31_05180, partial [Solirubrobacteraceae bacterium]|nr:hypothetical protein [Solirubrobacteraceae bacterium]